MEAPGRVFPLLVSRAQELYLVGGVDASGKHFGDVWRFSGRWERLATPTIPVRSGHVGFLFEDCIYAYGGQEEAVPNHIYEKWLKLSLQTLQWEEFAAPGSIQPRHSCSCVLHAEEAIAYVYGGASSTGIESDTLVLDIRTLHLGRASWSIFPTTHTPPGRMMHAASLCKGQMFVFGGIDAAQKVSPDLFCLTFASGEWRSLGVFVVDGVLMKMCGLAMTAVEDSLIVFGGMDLENLTIYNQVFVYEIGEAQWYRVPEQHPPRFGSCMAVQRSDSDCSVVLVGGCDMRSKAVSSSTESLSVARLHAAKEPL